MKDEEEDDTEMQRVGNTWMGFCIVGGIVGFGIFFTLRFVLSCPDWIAVPLAWIIGLYSAFLLSKFRTVRTLTRHNKKAFGIRWMLMNLFSK